MIFELLSTYLQSSGNPGLGGAGGCGGPDLCSFASPRSQSSVLRFLSRSFLALLSALSHRFSVGDEVGGGAGV
jgi:hypothetical protein